MSRRKTLIVMCVGINYIIAIIANYVIAYMVLRSEMQI